VYFQHLLTGTQTLENITVNKEIEFAKVGHKAAVVSTDKDSVMRRFPSSKGMKTVLQIRGYYEF